jgi:hypothetical protein
MTLKLTMFLSLVLFASAGPVKAEMDGNAWVKQSDEFKRGYSAGQLDSQFAWGAPLLSTGTVSENGKRTLQAFGEVARHTASCIQKKGISPDQLKKLTEDYLRAHPDEAKAPIVISMGEALSPICME